MQRRRSRNYRPSGYEDPRGSRARGGRNQQRNLFVEKTRRRFPVAWFLLFFVLLLSVMAVYNVVVNGLVHVETKTVTIPGLDRAYEGFTILHISDLHGTRFGEGQQQLLANIAKHSYNVVCMTGDMVGAGGDAYPLYELIEGLNNKQIFLIAGDEDPLAVLSEPHGSTEVLGDFVLGAQRRGATFLDSPVSVSYGSGTIWFAPELLYGLDLEASKQSYQTQLDADLEGGNSHLDSVQTRVRALRYRINTMQSTIEARDEVQSGDLFIALSHVPILNDNSGGLQTTGSKNMSFSTKIDLMLSGHYNAGQFRIPLLGALYLPNKNLPRGGWFPDQSLAEGLTRSGGILQHISPGLGAAQVFPIRMRLFNPPRVTILRLTSAISN